MSPPRVSVIIPNFNHARLLPRCLDAILNQSVLPWEILVLDDASTDDSLAVLDGYARRSPLIRVLPSERNQGVCAIMNRGLALASGEYVCFPAADDEVLPGWLAHTTALASAYPRAGLVSGLTEWRCQATGMTWHIGSRMPSRACYLEPAAMVKLGRTGRLSFSGQHALIQRTALIEAGGWITDLRWFTDWFGNSVVGFRHGIAHCPEVLSVFYLYPGSYYNQPEAIAQRQQTMNRLLEYLEEGQYADVAPLIRASGLLGGFGAQMARQVIRRRRYWHHLNAGFVWQASRRSAEVLGRRLFPGWLARACLRMFYRRR